MEFKVGDWVRSNVFGIGKIDSLHKGCTTTVRVKGWYTRDTRDNTRNYDINIQHCELWQPKVGEWVWSQVLDYKIPTIIEATQQHIDEDWLNSSNCEPLIGELPSFIKETK